MTRRDRVWRLATRREVAFNLAARVLFPVLGGIVTALTTSQLGWILVGLFVATVLFVAWLVATSG